MSLAETRHDQLYPVLDAGQIETAKRFASGPARDFTPDEVIFEAGERHVPAWLVLKGSIDVVIADRSCHLRPVAPASSPSATCVPARPSAWRRPWERELLS